ncbi:MAG: hypothetical protein AAFR04_07520 [Pseudomonadota bacterium]
MFETADRQRIAGTGNTMANGDYGDLSNFERRGAAPWPELPQEPSQEPPRQPPAEAPLSATAASPTSTPWPVQSEAPDEPAARLASRDGERESADPLCRADDLKSILNQIATQIAATDARHADAFRDMHERLETIGGRAHVAKTVVPPQFRSAFERLEDAIEMLAARIAHGDERQHAHEEARGATAVAPAPALAPADATDALPVLSSLGSAAPPKPQASDPVPSLAEAAAALTGKHSEAASAAKPATMPVPAPTGDQPWDDDAAEALSRLYNDGEQGEAGWHDDDAIASRVPDLATAMQALTQPEGLSAGPKARPDLAAPADGNATAGPQHASDVAAADRIWLAGRFSDIAERVERSLTDMRVGPSIDTLASRFNELEEHFGVALNEVATRRDVEGLRLVEAHISDLTEQVQETQKRLGRLDAIEEQLSAVTTQLSDDRLASFVSHAAPAQPDFEAMTATMAETVAREVTTQVMANLPAPAAETGANDELTTLFSTYMDERRAGDGQTAEALDTMQAALIKLLERMDVIETQHGETLNSLSALSSAPALAPAGVGDPSVDAMAGARGGPAPQEYVREAVRFSVDGTGGYPGPGGGPGGPGGGITPAHLNDVRNAAGRAVQAASMAAGGAGRHPRMEGPGAATALTDTPQDFEGVLADDLEAIGEPPPFGRRGVEPSAGIAATADVDAYGDAATALPVQQEPLAGDPAAMAGGASGPGGVQEAEAGRAPASRKGAFVAAARRAAEQANGGAAQAAQAAPAVMSAAPPFEGEASDAHVAAASEPRSAQQGPSASRPSASDPSADVRAGDAPAHQPGTARTTTPRPSGRVQATSVAPDRPEGGKRNLLLVAGVAALTIAIGGLVYGKFIGGSASPKVVKRQMLAPRPAGEAQQPRQADINGEPGLVLTPRAKGDGDDGVGEGNGAPAQRSQVTEPTIRGEQRPASGPTPIPDAFKPKAIPETVTDDLSNLKLPPGAKRITVAARASTPTLPGISIRPVPDAATRPAALTPDASGAAKAKRIRVPSDATSSLNMPPALIGPLSLRTAAAQGDPSASFEVAARYAEGKGVTRNFKRAFTWYRRSAAKGFAPAQYRLGTLYERGLGAPRDLARARIWYQRAARSGNVKAMHNLAVLSAGRASGTPDYTTAAQWFGAAAERGLGDSQFNLGVLYQAGLGVRRDLTRSYLWFALAAQRGDGQAGKRRDQVARLLTKDQMAKARAMLRSWKPVQVDRTVNDAVSAGRAWMRRKPRG